MAESDFGAGGVFVLGGSGCLGRAICEAFARARAPVSLTYLTNREAAEQCATRVRQLGVACFVFQLDGTDRAAVKRALEEAAAATGGLHSVVYAGGPDVTVDPFVATPEEVWQKWLRTDVMVAINLAQEAITHLRRTRGSFTSLSTYQGDMVEPCGGPSAIAKGAVDRMVKIVAKEEGRNGVRANSLRCGWIAGESTEAHFRDMPALREEKKRTIPLGRLGLPEEVGDTVVFLSSRRGGFITGVNLTADGGESL